MELRFKVWMEHGGRIVLGSGRADLLEAAAGTGSISAAARQLGMTYRHAWAMVRASEERLGQSLLTRTKGGRGGGGAQLTALAQMLLRQYRNTESRFAALARQESARLRGFGVMKEPRE